MIQLVTYNGPLKLPSYKTTAQSNYINGFEQNGVDQIFINVLNGHQHQKYTKLNRTAQYN